MKKLWLLTSLKPEVQVTRGLLSLGITSKEMLVLLGTVNSCKVCIDTWSVVLELQRSVVFYDIHNVGLANMKASIIPEVSNCD